MKSDSISIVVPTLNEEGNIKPLVKKIANSLKKEYEIIFVDDHSTDNTVSEINKLIRHYPIRLAIKNGQNGKTFSLIQGFKLAKYEYIAMIDADLQYPPSAIPKMLKIIIDNNADVVVSFRKQYNAPLNRKILSVISRFIAGAVWNFNHDTQSGLKVFKKSVFDSMKITTKNEWTFDLDFLIKAKKKGHRIINYDIVFNPRHKGDSKYSMMDTLEILKETIRLKRQL